MASPSGIPGQSLAHQFASLSEQVTQGFARIEDKFASFEARISELEGQLDPTSSKADAVVAEKGLTPRYLAAERRDVNVFEELRERGIDLAQPLASTAGAVATGSLASSQTLPASTGIEERAISASEADGSVSPISEFGFGLSSSQEYYDLEPMS